MNDEDFVDGEALERRNSGETPTSRRVFRSTGNPRAVHVWTHEEESVLVELLVQMRVRGQFMDERGFSAGYVRYIKHMMEQRSGECRLIGESDIRNAIKRLQQDWMTVYEMLYGPNAHGFSWDSVRNRVIGDDAVWGAYVAINRKAGKFRNKEFPLFSSLCNVWRGFRLHPG